MTGQRRRAWPFVIAAGICLFVGFWGFVYQGYTEDAGFEPTQSWPIGVGGYLLAGFAWDIFLADLAASAVSVFGSIAPAYAYENSNRVAYEEDAAIWTADVNGRVDVIRCPRATPPECSLHTRAWLL